MYLQNIDSSTFCSFMAKFRPIQWREPPPNGTYVKPKPACFSASPRGKNRSGLNKSGDFQYLGFLCILIASMTTVDPFGINVSPSMQSSVLIRGLLTGTGECKRSVYQKNRLIRQQY